MVVDGINFYNEAAIRAMTLDEFKAAHAMFYADLGEEEREKKLESVYCLLCPSKKPKKAKKAEADE